jgi:hypothetical protein
MSNDCRKPKRKYFMLLSRFGASFVLAIAVLAGLARSSAADEPLPFKGSLDGVHVSRTPLDQPRFFDVFEATGEATQLGRFKLVIETVVNFGTRPPTGEGYLTLTAANGDTLVADITGFSSLVVPGLVLITEHAIIDPDRSTGRFAGATGTFTIERLADAGTGVTGVTAGFFDGTISLAAPASR